MKLDPEVTGSSNISKVTPEWGELLVAAREQGAKLYEEPYLMHVAIAMVNTQVEYHGIPWTKCMDCGCPYRLDLPVAGRTSEFCSEECYDAYTDYLNNAMYGEHYDEAD